MVPNTDFIAPCVPTGLMFGRIGNFIGGELYGRAVTDPNYPFGMIFPTDPLHSGSSSFANLSSAL
jgi:phosphatidylglycerol:prolipoprotein diacylglycerol transferase